MNIRRVWPVAVIGFGFSVAAIWVGLLGYGLFKLVDLVI
jgi:hypothetical protein